MKHKNLLIITAVFSFLMTGCGAKPISTSKINYADYHKKLDQITIENVDDKNGKDAYETNGNLEIKVSGTDNTGASISSTISYKYNLKNDLNTILLSENMSMRAEQKVSGQNISAKTSMNNNLGLTKKDDSTYSMYLKKSVLVESDDESESTSGSLKATGKIYHAFAGSIIEKLQTNYSLYTIYLNEIVSNLSYQASQDNSAYFAYGEQDDNERFELDLKNLDNSIKLSAEYKGNLISSFELNMYANDKGSNTSLKMTSSTKKLNKKLSYPNDKNATEVSEDDGFQLLHQILFYNFSIKQ